MNAEKIIYHLLDVQGKMNDLPDEYYLEEGFFDLHTTTPEKEREFKEYALKYLKRQTGMSKKYCEYQAGYFLLMYGLKTIYPATNKM